MQNYTLNNLQQIQELWDWINQDSVPYQTTSSSIIVGDETFQFQTGLLTYLKNYIIVEQDWQFQKLLADLDSYELVTYDVESTGLCVHKDKIVGFGICGEVGKAYYIPLGIYRGTAQDGYIEWTKWSKPEFLQQIMQKLVTKRLITHNGTYDTRITKNDLGWDLLPFLYADTILMKHSVDEAPPFALKEIAAMKQRELGLDEELAADREQQLLEDNVVSKGGSWTKARKDMYMGDLPILGRYGCSDVDLTLRIYNYYLKEIEKEGLLDFFFTEEVMPLYKEVTIPMEDRGVRIDIPLIESVRKPLIEDMKKLEF